MKILRANLISAVAAALSVAVGQACLADAAVDATPIPPAQTSADLLIGKVVQTLQGASSISADFQEIDSYPGEYRDLKQAGSVVLSKSNKLKIEIQRFRRVSANDPWNPSGNNAKSVSDGTHYTYAFLHPHSTQIQQSDVDARTLHSALKGLPSLAEFFGNLSPNGLPGKTGAATSLPDASWDGANYSVVQYPVASRDGSGDIVATAYIGADDLVHRLVYTSSSSDGTTTREWTFSNVVVNASVPDSQFSYVPPKDATALDNSDVADILSPGAFAPDFTAYDQSGKPVKLSDYRGKTVILDFWATWCWPCNQSLPQTEKVGEQNKDQGVVVLAVAVRDSQVGFNDWLKRHNYPDINFLRDPAAQGKDAASTLYGVVTTPTAYVIDPNGKVVQAIAGYSGPSSELADAVSFALKRSTVASAQ